MVKAKRKSKKTNNDFSKKKHKVGTKKIASNATVTSFKAKTVHMPGQSVLQRHDPDTLTSVRGVALADLLTQTRHYNTNVRRDAVLGILGIAQRGKGLLTPHLASVLDATCPLVLDGEGGVRLAFRSLLQHFLDTLPTDVMSGFVALILAHIQSGMTHVHRLVRKDALALLLLWVRPACPHSVLLLPYADALLARYADLLLAPDGTSRKAVVSLADRVDVLANILAFLQAMRQARQSEQLSRVKDEDDGDGEGNDADRDDANAAAHRDHRLAAAGAAGAVLPDFHSWDAGSRSWSRNRRGTSLTPPQCPQSQSEAGVYTAKLLPFLADLWLECEPMQKDSLGQAGERNIAVILDVLAELMARVAPQDAAGLQPDLLAFMQHRVLVCFPFHNAANAAVCDVLQYAVTSSDAFLACHDVTHWLTDQLTSAKGSASAANAGVVPRALCFAVSVVRHAPAARVATLCDAIGVWVSRVRCPDPALRLMLQLVRDDAATAQRVLSHLPQWIAHLPRVLWKLNGRPAPTHLALSLLIEAGRRGIAEDALTKLQPELSAFWHTRVRGKDVFGPWLRLPTHLQLLAVDVLAWLGPAQDRLLRALAIACHCQRAVLREHVLAHLLYTLLHTSLNVCRGETVASFLLTVGAGAAPVLAQLSRPAVALAVLDAALQRDMLVVAIAAVAAAVAQHSDVSLHLPRLAGAIASALAQRDADALAYLPTLPAPVTRGVVRVWTSQQPGVDPAVIAVLPSVLRHMQTAECANDLALLLQQAQADRHVARTDVAALRACLLAL